MSYSDRLKKLAGVFKEAEPFGVRVPDGTYQTRISVCKVTESEKLEGRPLSLVMEFTILAPEKFENRKVTKYVRLEGDHAEMGMSDVKTIMERLDIKLSSIENLEKACGALVDKCVEIVVATSKKDPRYFNVYVNGRIELEDKAEKTERPKPKIVKAKAEPEEDVEEEAEAEAEESDDEKPTRKKPKPKSDDDEDFDLEF